MPINFSYFPAMQKIPKFPDFKHKDNENPLWLNTAPQWVVKKLDGLVFYGSCSTSNQEVTINEAHTQINDIGILLSFNDLFFYFLIFNLNFDHLIC